MVRPSGCRGDDDLGPVTGRTGRVQGRTVTASSRGVRGRHSTLDLPSTPTPLPPSFYYDTGAPGSSTQPPFVPFRSRPPLPLHLSQTPVPYEAYGFAHPHSQPPLTMVGAVQPDSSYSTHSYTVRDYGVSSSEPFMERQSADLRFEGDRGLGKEPDRDERADDGGNGDGDDDDDDDDDDNDDEGEDAGDDEQSVPVAPASRFDGWPHHGKEKGLTDTFISVMSKISGSRTKNLDKARDVPAPTQRNKGGPIDLELIPPYGGHVDRGLLNCRSSYMALTGWSLTDAGLFYWQLRQAWIYMYFPMFAPAVRAGTQSCKPYIQQYPMLGYKTEHKLLDIRLQLDMMSADKVTWMPYRL
ncbi:hypothetical protein M9H77_22280 [Catharanthus roseus]|uniref:Uncharacterized protein n=1 Tax=Catharanthus roseus TaxID=4058 RepID=A0ACC0ASK6_CATRO|nr:hypothetical protein M9H77_22280 [Catharanthus roseus]